MTNNKRVTLSILTALVLISFSFLFYSNKKQIEFVKNKKEELFTIFNFKGNKTSLQEKKVQIGLPDYPFRTGEKLKYGVFSTGLKVGDAIITYLGNKEINGIFTSCIILEVKVPGFYDEEKIYGNIENYAPIRVERKISLFGKNINIIEEYDQKNNVVLITRKSKNTEVQKIESQDKFGNVILMLYHFRYRKDYKIGDKLQFNLPTKRLDVLVDKKTDVDVPKGRFKSIFVKSIPSSFKVWFRDDEDGIPLRIQGVIGFGNTYLALIEVD